MKTIKSILIFFTLVLMGCPIPFEKFPPIINGDILISPVKNQYNKGDTISINFKTSEFKEEYKGYYGNNKDGHLSGCKLVLTFSISKKIKVISFKNNIDTLEDNTNSENQVIKVYLTQIGNDLVADTKLIVSDTGKFIIKEITIISENNCNFRTGFNLIKPTDYKPSCICNCDLNNIIKDRDFLICVSETKNKRFINKVFNHR